MFQSHRGQIFQNLGVAWGVVRSLASKHQNYSRWAQADRKFGSEKINLILLEVYPLAPESWSIFLGSTLNSNCFSFKVIGHPLYWVYSLEFKSNLTWLESIKTVSFAAFTISNGHTNWSNRFINFSVPWLILSSLFDFRTFHKYFIGFQKSLNCVWKLFPFYPCRFFYFGSAIGLFIRRGLS